MEIEDDSVLVVKGEGLKGFHVVVSLIIFNTLLKITVESIGVSIKLNVNLKKVTSFVIIVFLFFFFWNVITKMIAIVKYRRHQESIFV